MLALAGLLAVATGCDIDPQTDERGQAVGYRDGTVDDDYLSTGERGNVLITEVNWAGSVKVLPNGSRAYDPDDVFIELQNKHFRPVHFTGWQIIVLVGTGDDIADLEVERNDRATRTYIIPPRANGEPVQVNEYVVIAAKLDGAFRDSADYLIEGMTLPRDHFAITLRDVDDRLGEGAGSRMQEVYAGSYDLVTVRSMERVQLIFSNQGARETSWHTYSYNEWDPRHAELNSGVHSDYRRYTLASPGHANSPDYSGNTSSGNFE
jgi:hypothetical protein